MRFWICCSDSSTSSISLSIVQKASISIFLYFFKADLPCRQFRWDSALVYTDSIHTDDTGFIRKYRYMIPTGGRYFSVNEQFFQTFAAAGTADAVTASDFKVCTTTSLEESTIYIDSIGRVGTSLKKHLRDAYGTRRRIVHLECIPMR